MRRTMNDLAQFAEARELHFEAIAMYNAEALEAINVEQLVTATDRILLRGHRRRRATIDFTREAAAAVAASRAREAEEKTVFVRGPLKRPFVGPAAFVAAAWLCVTFACLLS